LGIFFDFFIIFSPIAIDRYLTDDYHPDIGNFCQEGNGDE
jgi:hypothetical protein